MTYVHTVWEVVGREWEVVSAAPFAFLIGVVLVGSVIGMLVGYVLWRHRDAAVRSRIEMLRARKSAEDEVLKLVRARHEHEMEVREEIESEFARLQRVVERLHNGDTTADHLIADASAATAMAISELKREHEEFVRRMRSWDKECGPDHGPVAHEHSNWSR